MAKLSGFFMSTLLIVLCLWINVCHYPDAARTAPTLDEAAPSVDVVPQAVSPASEPVEEAEPEQAPVREGGLLADVGDAPELLDVSASRPSPSPFPAADSPESPAVLEPASFPVDGAEIDDAPTPTFPAPSVGDSKSLSPTSPAVATPTPQDARRAATKPRGAKYVRVPEVEIDAFSGGVRTARAPGDETRVVGATRAGQTLSVVPSAP